MFQAKKKNEFPAQLEVIFSKDYVTESPKDSGQNVISGKKIKKKTTSSEPSIKAASPKKFFGIQPPVKQSAFGRSHKIDRNKLVKQTLARNQAINSANMQPPMDEIWGIIQNLQSKYRDGQDISCQGGHNFHCNPNDHQVSSFIQSQWRVMHLGNPRMPKLTLTRESGFWRLEDISP